jgi:RNA polymerase sigma factor (sigma-70 family)
MARLDASCQTSASATQPNLPRATPVNADLASPQAKPYSRHVSFSNAGAGIARPVLSQLEHSSVTGSIDAFPRGTSASTTSPFASSASKNAVEREQAWDSFVASNSQLLLRVARAVTHDHDAMMDAYAFVLDQLRESNFKRLCSYNVTDGCTFETWLAVVTRRLCHDHYRHKYGRFRGDDAKSDDAHRERRRLADLVSVEIDSELATNNAAPDAAFEQAEILRALESILIDFTARDRLLLRYRFDDGLSAIQIMRVMKFRTVFHVYRRVNSLLGVCRSELQRKGFRSSDA